MPEPISSFRSFFLTTGFFTNSLTGRKKAGISKPVVPGIMPMLAKPQLERMIYMCGASMPSAIVKLLHKYEDKPDDLRKAGIEYAAEQIKDLLEKPKRRRTYLHNESAEYRETHT